MAEEAKPTEAAPVVAKEGIIKGKVLTTPAVRRIAAQFKVRIFYKNVALTILNHRQY